MRPEILFALFTDIKTLPGIGAKTRFLYEKLAGTRLIDLIYHLPSACIDRRAMPSIMDMKDGIVATSIVQIEEHIPPARPRDKNSPFKVRCYNETGFLTLVFFRAYPDYLKKQLPIGEKRAISGKVERFGGEVQIAHPDYIEPVSRLKDIQKIEPVYPLTAGLGQKNLRKSLTAALDKTPNLPEWIDPFFMKRNNWQSWKKSLLKAHNPETDAEIESSPAKNRLAYDELLASQLALKIVRKHVSHVKGRSIKGGGDLRQKLLEKLPFKLTNGQEEVIKQIHADQESEERMMRLLQGDVGSGKTVVALFSALNAVEAGKQAAIMAPTEILAGQHYKWISEITDEIGINIGYLVGSIKGKQRAQLLEQLENGEIDLLIGTHALFQDKVIFKNLGLAIIDEQHRFGVNQRLSLANKGQNIDMLLMTATPIPRTLTLAMYGDMEVSLLKDKPAGRKEINTKVLPASKIDPILDGIGRVIEKGQKTYWICPLVEESELIDLAAAENRYNEFRRVFGHNKVGLVHGKMPTNERQEVMLKFRDGEIDLLVATTVIEVGVDVKDATVIVIEHAERFGLSQLHQLRGRVGRNDMNSSCILLYHALGEIAKERLTIMRESNDGFYLAEEDLRLRGGGEVLGTKQSGLPNFKIANLTEHFDLLKAANDDSKLIMQTDPDLQTTRGKALRTLLYLFEYDSQMKYLKVG